MPLKDAVLHSCSCVRWLSSPSVPAEPSPADAQENTAQGNKYQPSWLLVPAVWYLLLTTSPLPSSLSNVPRGEIAVSDNTMAVSQTEANRPAAEAEVRLPPHQKATFDHVEKQPVHLALPPLESLHRF